jgi:hypothetical protein
VAKFTKQHFDAVAEALKDGREFVVRAYADAADTGHYSDNVTEIGESVLSGYDDACHALLDLFKASDENFDVRKFRAAAGF